MKKRIIFVVIALIAFATMFLLNSKNETVLKNDTVSIKFNKKFEVETHDNEQFLIIPINTDLSDITAIVTKKSIVIDAVSVHDFILAIDTFVPKEYSKTFKLANKEVKINVIVR